jgi:molecular chaperone DnaK
LSDEEIEKMKAEALANAEADEKARAAVEVVNKADSLIFQTERQLKEYGEKIPADKKQPIEDALTELKKEFEAKNMDNLEPAMDKLNEVFQAASEDMYKESGAEGGQSTEGASEENASGEDEVTDVDFEEVEEEETK